MNAHRRIIFLLVLLAVFALYGLQKALAACPVTETGVVSLVPADMRNQTLARAFSQHVAQRGQNPEMVMGIYRASLRTGVDFRIMLMKAILESDLGRHHAATNSSARGIFQFIEPTWLVLIKRYGTELGYAHYAGAIHITKGSGIPYIPNGLKYLRAEILALRYDPEVSALIKALQMREESEFIKTLKNGQSITATDHYIAHMLGLSLAQEFYDLRARNSVIAVASLNRPDMREAARLNPLFFYENGTKLTAAESYKKFERRIAREYGRIESIEHGYILAACAAHDPPDPHMIRTILPQELDLALMGEGLRSSFTPMRR